MANVYTAVFGVFEKRSNKKKYLRSAVDVFVGSKLVPHDKVLATGS